LIEGYKALDNDRKPGFVKVHTALEKELPDSALPPTLEGIFFTDYAWDTRTGKSAKDVTEAQSELFKERLARAEAALERALRLDPNNARAATQMLSVELGQGKGRTHMEEWFRRAMKADPGNYSACSRKLLYLEPKWYGSEEEMLAFGRECLATENWNARLPFVLTDAHFVLARYPRDQEGKIDLKSDKYSEQPKVEYYQRPGVWEDVKAVYEPYLKQFPKAVNDRSMFAKLACWCGRWDEARRQFLILGEKPSLTAFGGREEYDRLRAEAARRAGAVSE